MSRVRTRLATHAEACLGLAHSWHHPHASFNPLSCRGIDKSSVVDLDSERGLSSFQFLEQLNAECCIKTKIEQLDHRVSITIVRNTIKSYPMRKQRMYTRAT